MFIVIEGIDGAGKTTQATLLAETLEQRGHRPLVIQEPGTTELGRRIRSVVKGDGDEPPPISGLAELLLFGAARAQLVEEVLRPALAEGRTVVADRYSYSTVAYQGAGRGLDSDAIAVVNRTATGGVLPDLVILLDVSVESARQRQLGRGDDRFDGESVAFYERVRASYRGQAASDPGRWVVLDAAQPAGVLAGAIWKNVEQRLGRA